ncbi:bifunctional phosphopantothenoylcysteine decarboxylase/phosphopantothenate--cysteine ligase CoaBC [Oscillospiraceae bacterium HV4-5-C5C]|nr:bifunctional phosphopantothenoylcysteine decarboxylase/phosphopantothenate--cysteine ligase CoaBC [Oscillospiraceae bacterium HV4-5-C5C]
MKKTIVLGVSSSIAAYKSAQLTSDLLKLGYDVEVIMTRHATQLIQPLTFSALTHHKTYVDTFDRQVNYDIEHISLAHKADAFIAAPATANLIAKLAAGLADDMLTTTFLAADCPKFIAPAMNTAMLNNPATQANLQTLAARGIQIIHSASGRLACGDTGAGKLASLTDIIAALSTQLESQASLAGRRVLISAGPTREAIDPVRFISNPSSGRMGYALARQARLMGAEVTLVSGPVELTPPPAVRVIPVVTAAEMAQALKQEYARADLVFMAAAVADYYLPQPAGSKIKKAESMLTLTLSRTEDILAWMGDHKTHQKLCGFAMETENLLANARQKFERKHCDLLVANDLTEAGAGFGHDTNAVSLISRQSVRKLPLQSKDAVARQLLLALEAL